MKPAMTQGVLRPSIPLAAIHASLPAIQYQDTCTGKIALSGGAVVGWIYPGSYRTQRHDKHFYDVAYIKPCTTKAGDHTGFMLDSECFDTEEQALLFIESLMLGKGGAA